jgi:hypothetical protein
MTTVRWPRDRHSGGAVAKRGKRALAMREIMHTLLAVSTYLYQSFGANEFAQA